MNINQYEAQPHFHCQIVTMREGTTVPAKELLEFLPVADVDFVHDLASATHQVKS